RRNRSRHPEYPAAGRAGPAAGLNPRQQPGVDAVASVTATGTFLALLVGRTGAFLALLVSRTGTFLTLLVRRAGTFLALRMRVGHALVLIRLGGHFHA